MIEFELEGNPFIQLNNLLKVTGLCHSGGVANKIIEQGLVSVDGSIETRKRCKITEGQLVEFQGNDIIVRS